MESESIYQLILSVLTNEASEEEKKSFSRWLKESDDNKREFEKVRRLYLTSSSKRKEQVYDTDSAWNKVHKQTIRKKEVRFTGMFLRYAAMIMVVISTGVYFYITNSNDKLVADTEQFDQPTLLLHNGKRILLEEKEFSMQQQHITIKNNTDRKLIYEKSNTVSNEKSEQNHLIVPKGKTYQLVLSDGTKIWMNSESEIIYPLLFNGNKREVTLVGEAYFDVAKDKNKPFYIKANGIDVKVLGTVFNVSCYSKDKTITTTLVEGSVCIQTQNGKEQIIAPSEQLSYNKEHLDIEVKTVNTELYTSWINGEYIFKDAPLEDIIAKLQHWHDFTVSYQNEKIKSYRFSLTVSRNTSLDQLLEIINFTSEVKLERINNNINIKEYQKE